MEVSNTSHRSSLQLVTEFGIHPDLIGCHYIARAVELYSAKSCNFRNIYCSVAKEFSVSYKNVVRCISYAIDNAYGLREKLSRAFGINIPPMEVHSSLVIAYLNVLWTNS